MQEGTEHIPSDGDENKHGSENMVLKPVLFSQ